MEDIEKIEIKIEKFENKDNIPEKQTHFLKKRKYVLGKPKYPFEKHSNRKTQTFHSLIKYINYFIIITIAIIMGHYSLIMGNYFFVSEPRESVILDRLFYDLQNKLFQQEAVTNTLRDSFKLFVNSTSEKILVVLAGSSGVGKTYVTNIIKKHINSKLVFSFNSMDLPEILNKVNVSAGNDFPNFCVIMIDDLKMFDLERLHEYLANLFNTEEKNVLLIVFFNIQKCDSELNFDIDYNDYTTIKTRLKKLSKHFYFQTFNEIKEKTVKTWLTNQLIAENVDIMLHEKIIENVLEYHNLKHLGLKGLRSKLILQLDKYDYK